MDAERYPRAVAAYLRAEGWETSGTRVQDDVFAILARKSGGDGERRLLALVVAGTDATVGQDHLTYLRKAGAKKDADGLCVTTQGTLSADARALAEKYDVTRLDSETVVAAVTDGDEGATDQSAGGSPRQADQSRQANQSAQTERARSSPNQHRQPNRGQQRARSDAETQSRADRQQTGRTSDQQGGHESGRRGQDWVKQAEQAARAGGRTAVERLRRLEVPENSGQRLRRAVGRAPRRGGLFRGVGVYVAAVVFAAILHVLVTGPQVEALFTPSGGISVQVVGTTLESTRTGSNSPLPAAVVEGAWLLYSTQGVDILGSTLPVEGNLVTAAVDGNIAPAAAREYALGLRANTDGAVTELGQLFAGFRLLSVVVPFLLFTEAYRLVAGAYDGDASLLDQAVGGASLVVGYLPLAVAGAVLFTRMGAAPSLGGAVVSAGLVQPLVYGTAGGAAAAVLRGRDARLRRGGYYGVAAALLAVVGTFVVTLVGSDAVSAGVAVVATLVAFSHAVTFAVPSGAVPGLLYAAVVVGAIAVVGRFLTRSYRGTGRQVDAATTGSTLAVGIGAALFATLFVVLVLLVSFDAAIFGDAVAALGLTTDEAIPMHPAETVVVGGIVVPALVGGGVGAYLAQTPE